MNVKKLLKENSSAILPGENVKNRIKADCTVCEDVPVRLGKTVALKRKVGISVAAVGMAIVGAVTAILICLNGSLPASPLPEVIQFGSISSATDFYSYSAVSVGNMLDSTSTSLASTYSLTTPLSKISSVQKGLLGKYATFATGALGDGKITSSYTTNDKQDYQYKLGIGYLDGFGVSEEKVLYFNKIEESIKIEEDEEEFDIVGELVSGGVSYLVEGNYELERDGEESESEVEFTAYTSADKNSYIVVEYEVESNSVINEVESEFVITVYEKGKLVESATIKSQGENDGYELNVTSGGEKVKLKFNPDEKDGKKLMGVHASFGDEDFKLIMRPQNSLDDGFDFIEYDDWEEEEWDFDDWDFDFGDWGKNDGGWYDDFSAEHGKPNRPDEDFDHDNNPHRWH